MRQAVWDLDPSLPIATVRSMEEHVAESITSPRFFAWSFTTFAAIALVLASVRIYGAMTYSVEQRISEFGLRKALGADNDDVVRLVIRPGRNARAVRSSHEFSVWRDADGPGDTCPRCHSPRDGGRRRRLRAVASSRKGGPYDYVTTGIVTLYLPLIWDMSRFGPGSKLTTSNHSTPSSDHQPECYSNGYHSQHD